MLPQWTQSQLSISDMNMNSDTMSIHTMPRTQSISEFNADFDKRQLVRQDTDVSCHSHSNSGSVTPI